MTLGKFITFEGPDASGKSTNIPVLADHLRSRGYRVVQMREPGGTPLAEKIRDLVLHERMATKAELLLFAAQRVQNMAEIITPSLQWKDTVVIADRFADSTFAYQGFGRGMMEEVLLLEKFVLGDFQPHYTLFFDLPLIESERRLNERRKTTGQGFDTFEQERREFHECVYNGYQERYKQNPHRMYRIDALPSIEEVSKQVISWANAHFENLN
jgi:dTMP kinase